MEQSKEVPDASEGELAQYFRKFTSNWYWIALGALAGIAAAMVYLRYAAPVYKVRAKVLVNDEQKGSIQHELIDLNSLLGTRNSVDNEAEVLKTRFLMEKTVRGIGANITYYKKGRIRHPEIYPAPFEVIVLEGADTVRPVQFDLEFIDERMVRVSNESFRLSTPFDCPFRVEGLGTLTIRRNRQQPVYYDGYRFSIRSVDDQVADYMRRLTVDVTSKQVTVIDLSFDYPIPQKGEFVLNTLINQYVKGTLEEKNLIADSTIAFIEERLLFVSRELWDVEGSIQQFKQRAKLADLSGQSKLLLESASGNTKQLTELETQIDMVKNLSSLLQDHTQRVLPSAVLTSDPVFNGLVERYNVLLLERDRLLLSATEKNPSVQNLDQQIVNLRKDMLTNLSSAGNSLRIAKNELLARGRQMEGEIRKVPATERTYLDLARQQLIKQELYVFLLKKREETAISKTSNIANSKVIDPPKSDNRPFGPQRMRIMMLGLMCGLCFPVGILYVQTMFNNKVVHRMDISSRTAVPVIAEIGNSPEDRKVIVTEGNRSHVAEQLRTLRTNLSFFLKEGDKTILLTSSMSGEGKSFMALNLAAVLAISGKKVLVMEMDLRKPKVTQKLDRQNNFGLTNYIISPNLLPEDIVTPTGIMDNMYLVSSGPVPPNPAEIILNSRMDVLMDELHRQFDYIIIDAPPVGLVTDAQLLSKYADLTLYLVRQRFTLKSQLGIVNDLSHQRKMKNIAILVNDIRNNGSEYGYQYYQNGYVYYEDEAPRTLKDRIRTFVKSMT